MTAFLDWISQQLTSASLWIQSPVVILGSVIICTVLALLLLRIIDFLGFWIPRLLNRMPWQQWKAKLANTSVQDENKDEVVHG